MLNVTNSPCGLLSDCHGWFDTCKTGGDIWQKNIEKLTYPNGSQTVSSHIKSYILNGLAEEIYK